MSETRTPITLLTGFLGAGKSSLLNVILANPGKEKIAVIINEYGEVGLDQDLVDAPDDEVMMLESGCICCTIRDDLEHTIYDLIARRDAGELTFSRIVIETTGLADPAPIQQILVTNKGLRKIAFLDGIVTLVDCMNGARTLDRQFEAVSQVVMADLVLLTKADIAQVAQVQALRARLETLNAKAKIRDVKRARENPALLWGCAGFRPDITAAQAVNWLAMPGEAATVDPLANLSGLAPAQSVDRPVISAHDGQIKTASIVIEHPLDRTKLETWLKELLAMRGEDILRVKGLVFLKEKEEPMVFHAVQNVFEGPLRMENWSGGIRHSKVVIIARNLSETRLKRTLGKLAS
ncbi:MAG: GTP-binding protein [Litoreibacter sp.]|nr:GTP-binding protein [Litoreibacter sp.]MCY4335432.1 GTP-binding protein [Litoreibacter sp.]